MVFRIVLAVGSALLLCDAHVIFVVAEKLQFAKSSSEIASGKTDTQQLQAHLQGRKSGAALRSQECSMDSVAAIVNLLRCHAGLLFKPGQQVSAEEVITKLGSLADALHFRASKLQLRKVCAALEEQDGRRPGFRVATGAGRSLPSQTEAQNVPYQRLHW